MVLNFRHLENEAVLFDPSTCGAWQWWHWRNNTVFYLGIPGKFLPYSLRFFTSTKQTTARMPLLCVSWPFWSWRAAPLHLAVPMNSGAQVHRCQWYLKDSTCHQMCFLPGTLNVAWIFPPSSIFVQCCSLRHTRSHGGQSITSPSPCGM